MFLSKQSLHALGIDLADRSLRAVELRRTGFGRFARTHLHAWSEVGLPPDVVVRGEVKNPATLTVKLRELMDAARPRRFTTNGVVVALPDERCFVKTITVDDQTTDLASAVRTAAASELPIPFDSAAFDWAAIGSRAQDGRARVVTVAAPRDLVASWTAAFEAAGLTLYAAEVEGSAIVRSLNFPARDAEWPLAAVDIGASRTSFMLYDHGAIHLTVTIPVSGNAFTDQIAGGLDIPWEKAEELKISCGLDPARCETKLRGLVETMLNDLVEGIRMAIRYYKTQAGKSSDRLKCVYLVGGGSHVYKIDAVLAQKLYLKVRIGNPLEGIRSPVSFPRDKAEVFATAIGAGLRGLEPIDKLLGAHRQI